MEDIIQHQLKRLSRGLYQNSSKQIYTSHRLLVDIVKPVIPIIKEQLLGQSWQEIKYAEQLNILSGLLSLVNDIDEAASREIGSAIEQSGCSSIASTRIKTILDFTLNEFHSYDIIGVKIYQSKSLEQNNRIKKYMTRWLSIVPSSDLSQVERIYIIPKSNEDHRGTYMPILCNIMVEWIMPFSYYNPFSWVFMLQIEKTLFHEIGHHVGNHTFGYDLDQEKEADEYAAKIFAKNHPWLRIFVKLLKAVFGGQKKAVKDVGVIKF